MNEQITFASISTAYAQQLNEHRDKINAVRAKIDVKEKQLARLQTKEKAFNAVYPRWTELLLRPLLIRLQELFPEYKWDEDSLTPMGLGSRVLVFFVKDATLPQADRYDEGNSIYVSFQPGELDKGELLYETGDNTQSYKPGTIGEINGFNNVTKPVETIEEIIAFMKSKII
jgi:hypothetical protein